MKNINIKILLSITICLLVIANVNVFAGNATGSIGTQIKPDITYYPEGTNGQSFSYVYNPLSMKMNGKTYRAFCVDPGLRFSQADNAYTCSSFYDPGLSWLFSKYGSVDELTLSSAIRFYGVTRGWISTKVITGVYVKAAYARHVQTNYLINLYPNGQDTNGKTYQQMVNEYGTTFFTGSDIRYINEGYDLFKQAMDIFYANENSTGSTSSIMNFQKVSVSGTNVTYSVTSTQNIPKSSLTFGCTGANCRVVNQSWNGRSGSITVSVDCDKDYNLTATFPGAGGTGIYGCTTNVADQQDVYMYVPNDNTISFPGTPIFCGGECCTEKPIEPGYIYGNVNNCCTDNTKSEAHEYDLDDLFCYSNDLKVDHYTPKCGTEYYVDENTGLNSKYCKMYCTERVSVEIPGAITATSGRYFKLKETSYGTKSPYIEGYRRCRVRVEYDEWEKDYKAQVQKQVNAYNEFQKNEAYRLTYSSASTTNKELVLKCKAECSNKGAYCKKTWDFSTSYSQYRITTAYDWYGVSTNGLSISGATKMGSTSSEVGKWYSGNWKGNKDNFTPAKVNLFINQYYNYKNSSENVCNTTRGDQCNAKWSCWVEKGNIEETKSAASNVGDFNQFITNYSNAASQAQSQYTAATNAALALEKDLDKCDNYFGSSQHHAVSGNYKGSNASENYDFNAAVKFYYTQVYLNEEGKSVLDQQNIKFKDLPGCVVEGPILGPDYTDGLSGKKYGVSGTSKKSLRDFRNATLSYQTGNGYTNYLDTTYKADPVYTHDAKYKVTCSWDEDEKNKYLTLVPNGSVSEQTSEINYTEHDREYRLHLTTFDGTYETHWKLSGLGTNGRFDSYFLNNGKTTCAGESPADTSMLTCKLHVEYEVILTGYCNGSYGTDTTVNPDDCDKYEEKMGLFNFRIVDPSNIFPGGTTQDGKEFAYNWVKEEKGLAVKAEIEKRGAEDMTYAPENLTYSFTLTPSDMKHIKNYNQERISYGGYSDFRLNCTCGDACTKCKSQFIEDLSKGYVKYDSSNHTVTGWTGTKTLTQVRSSVIGG